MQYQDEYYTRNVWPEQTTGKKGEYVTKYHWNIVNESNTVLAAGWSYLPMVSVRVSRRASEEIHEWQDVSRRSMLEPEQLILDLGSLR